MKGGEWLQSYLASDGEGGWRHVLVTLKHGDFLRAACKPAWRAVWWSNRDLRYHEADFRDRPLQGDICGLLRESEQADDVIFWDEIPN